MAGLATQRPRHVLTSAAHAHAVGTLLAHGGREVVGSVAALANELVPMDRDGCMVGGYMATMNPFFLVVLSSCSFVPREVQRYCR